MKTINVTFTDTEFKRLLRIKGELNWHDMILSTASHFETSEREMRVK